MKTVMDLLTEKELGELIVEGVKQWGGVFNRETMETHLQGPADHCIDNAIEWDQTSQGFRYWADIHERCGGGYREL